MPRAGAVGAQPFAVVDVETTGLSPWLHDRVVEVAVVKMDPARGILDEYVTLVNPDRDVGPTWIHGITATDVRAAPRFSQIAGDVAARLEGAILAGHNVRFDLGFLTSEFARASVNLPPLPAVCTLGLARRFASKTPSRKLKHCCEEAGVAYEEAHSALGDARATAHLLGCYLAAASYAGLRSLEEIGCKPLELPEQPWCSVPASGIVLQRESARAAVADERGYLARLIERLPPTPFDDPDEAAYLDLLDRCLEDRKITEDEADTLFRTAGEWGLSRARVFEAHHAYLAGLARVALTDGVVSAVERQDLEAVCEMLGLHRSALEQTLAAARQPVAVAGPAEPAARCALAGMSVCFTGAIPGTFNGAPITRDAAEALAAGAGLFVRKNVTKSLDLLVVADPETASGKAKKAREGGIRLMAAAAFFQAIGVQVG
jgi:DNA polymerase-3 subunit epsilon